MNIGETMKILRWCIYRNKHGRYEANKLLFGVIWTPWAMMDADTFGSAKEYESEEQARSAIEKCEQRKTKAGVVWMEKP